MATQATKRSVYEIITDRFIEQLKQGIIPWEKPWLSIQGARVGGYSHTTGQPYSLINQMMLPSEGEYITYRQIQDEGGRLKKGSKGYPICFWKSYTSTQKNTDTNLDEEVTIPVLRYYTVFRVEDCEGIKPKYEVDLSPLDGLKEPQRCKKADELVKSYLERSGVKLVHQAGDQAYYSTLEDRVVLPLKKQFAKKSEYYSTLFHELVHSTGSVNRLNRFGAGVKTARGKSYSLEELVAEVGASSLNYIFRLETKDSIKNSAAYIQSWIKTFQNDDRMIVKAASRAQKAVQYIFGEEVYPCNDKKPFVNKVDTNIVAEPLNEAMPF